MSADVFGEAMLDYFREGKDIRIVTCSSLEEEDSIPVSYLFRDYRAMPEIERTALDICRGKVLDIGCGAGSHSLHLQGKGQRVTALDISPGAIEVCGLRGLKDVVISDFWDFEGQGYDTLLLLMNGIGIVGQLQKLPVFLSKAREVMNPSGQILFDSSDIIYMFEEEKTGEYRIPSRDAYYGEVVFEVAYGKKKGDPFPWLYVDYKTVDRIAREHGFNCELVRKGEHYDYLAKLTLSV